MLTVIPPPSPEAGHAGVVVLGRADLCVRVRLAFLPAQLASFRERRAKGDSEGAQKKTAKRKGQNVPKIDRPAQERPLEPAPAPASGAKEKCKINHEVGLLVQIIYLVLRDVHPKPDRHVHPKPDRPDKMLKGLHVLLIWTHSLFIADLYYFCIELHYIV